MTRRLRVTVLAATLFSFGLLRQDSHAAETIAELRLGGLILSKPGEPTLEIQSIDIAISPETVTVKYRVLNSAASPASVTMSFPVPELDFSDPDMSYAIPASDPVNFIGLSTQIGGKPGGFVFTQSAQLNGKDISSMLRQMKLPMVPIGSFQNQLSSLTAEQLDKLVQTGAIQQAGNDVDGKPIYFPAWSVRTTSIKHYAFAPGIPVELAIRYRTSVGAGLDTPLRLPLRKNANLATIVEQYRKDYCIDDSFYVGLDKISTSTEANTNRLREQLIIFALSTGQEQPIRTKDFRLVIDKGRADRVVTFCLQNLKRQSPTSFEMRAADFVPEGDLKVLMIGRN